jgi:hypothetical protein
MPLPQIGFGLAANACSPAKENPEKIMARIRP